MNLDLITIEDKLKSAWLDEIFEDEDIRIIQANQNARRPKLPYAVIDDQTSTKLGGAYYSPSDNTGKQEVLTFHRLPVVVHFFGKGVSSFASRAQDSLEKFTVLQAIRAEGFKIVGEPTLAKLPITRGETVEERWELTIFVHYNREFTDQVGYIESIDYTANIVRP